MSLRPVLVALWALPFVARAQQPARSDTLHQHGDSLTRRVIELAPITVTATPARRLEPGSSIRVSPEAIVRAPATDAYDLLRQTAGIDAHEQGHAPRLASDASGR